MTDFAALETAYRALLEEAFAGAEQKFFTDGQGLLPTLEGLSAAEASRSFAPHPSIAGHTEHLRWSLHNVNTVMAGGAWNPNWAESWHTSSVDEATWADLRGALEREYRTFQAGIGHANWADPMHMAGLLGSLAHISYHLGAIRQRLP